MNVVFSLILLAAALGCIVFLLTRRENARRSIPADVRRRVHRSNFFRVCRHDALELVDLFQRCHQRVLSLIHI